MSSPHSCISSKAARAVALQCDADLGTGCHGKTVDLEVTADARDLHIAALAVELFHQPFGHWRADGVVVAAEKHRRGQGGLTCSPSKMQNADQGEKPPGRIDIDFCLALQALLQHPRAFVVDASRAMSMASIWLGGNFLTASK